MAMNLCADFVCFVDGKLWSVYWTNIKEEGERCFIFSAASGNFLPMDSDQMKDIVLNSERECEDFSRGSVIINDVTPPKDTEEWFMDHLGKDRLYLCRVFYRMVVDDHVKQVTEKYTAAFLLDYLETLAENPGIVDMIFRATIEGCMVPDGEGGERFDEDLFFKYIDE